MNPQLKLYSFVPQDSSGKVRWLLHELNLEFENVELDYKRGDTKLPEFIELSPLGQIPVLEIEGVPHFESYNIVQLLSDKFAEGKMAPDFRDTRARTEYMKWVFFSLGSVQPFFNRLNRIEKMSDAYREEWGGYIEKKVEMILNYIEKELDGQKSNGGYILGKFSSADILLAYELDEISQNPLFKKFPLINEYFNRLLERPACIKSKIFERR